MVAVRQADPHDGKRPENEKSAVGPPRPEPVTQPSRKKPRQDSNRHGGDDRVSNLRLRQLQVFAYHRHQWGDSEPSDKTDKESKPRKVERAHGSRAEVQQTDARGLA